MKGLAPQEIYAGRVSTSAPAAPAWTGVAIEGPSLDPWRVTLPQPLTLCWEQQGTSVAGFGVAAEVVGRGPDALDAIARLQWSVEGEEEPGPPGFLGPWFGGLAFDPARAPDPDWAGFPTLRFVLPEVLVWRRAGAQRAVAFGVGPMRTAQAQERLATAQRSLSLTRDFRARGDTVEARSDPAAWRAQVGRALAAIARGELGKVVVARAIEVDLSAPVDALACADVLRRRAGPAAVFFLRGTDGSAFFGATPERLCRLEGGRLETEALASSARPSESAALAREDKEQREHLTVVEGIRAALLPLAADLHVAAEPRLLELPYVSHLRTPVRAMLKPGVGIVQVLRAMYPTAAVGGAPRERARSFIAREEGWDRGWYAGAIGWVGPRGADLHVAIRSGWTLGRRARVFVGAGVIAGSQAEREWQETEDKARPMLQALAEAHALP